MDDATAARLIRLRALVDMGGLVPRSDVTWMLDLIELQGKALHHIEMLTVNFLKDVSNG